MWRDSAICVIWLVEMYDRIRRHAWHDSWMRVTWLIHVRHDLATRDMTHAYVPCLIHMCRDSFTCDLTRPTWHDSKMLHVKKMLDVRHVQHNSAHGHNESHVKESWHIWMSHVTHRWENTTLTVLNDSPWPLIVADEWMSHGTYEWVMSHIHKSQHMWMSHGTYEWVTARMHETCHLRHDSATRDMTQAYVPWLIHMCRDSFIHVYHD